MRALSDSLERESELQRQLRRTKESLISVALRLQVAIKVSKEDEITIASLQTQALDARTKELLANRQAHEAAEMINSLTLEINALKRKLKAHSDAEKSQLEKINAQNNQMQNEIADFEVDEMNEQKDMDKIIPLTNAAVLGDNKPPATATPFERWKMNQFLYSPDTPAAAANHDKHVVDMLLEAATAEFDDDIHRPTRSGIAKYSRRSLTPMGLKPLLKSASAQGGLKQSTILGADIFENLAAEFLKTSDPDAHYIPSHHKPDQTYFLSKSQPAAMWGQGQRFDKTNMGRMNLWTAGQSAVANDSSRTAAGAASSPPPLTTGGGAAGRKHAKNGYSNSVGASAAAGGGGAASPTRTLRNTGIALTGAGNDGTGVGSGKYSKGINSMIV